MSLPKCWNSFNQSHKINHFLDYKVSANTNNALFVLETWLAKTLLENLNAKDILHIKNAYSNITVPSKV